MSRLIRADYKKGNFVQVYQPVAARIKRVNRDRGYTLEVFPTPKYETAYYEAKELIKLKKSDLEKYVDEKVLPSLLTTEKEGKDEPKI